MEAIYLFFCWVLYIFGWTLGSWIIEAHGKNVSVGGSIVEWKNLATGEKLHWLAICRTHTQVLADNLAIVASISTKAKKEMSDKLHYQCK